MVRKKKVLTKTSLIWLSGVLAFLIGSGLWAWNRFGPSGHKTYVQVTESFPMARTLDSASNACDLTIRRYRQIGREMQFELAANAGGLSPYDVKITQNGKTQTFQAVPHRFGAWLTIPDVQAKGGEAQIHISSLGQQGCQTTAVCNGEGE